MTDLLEDAGQRDADITFDALPRRLVYSKRTCIDAIGDATSDIGVQLVGT
jgi:hypothetical protein